MRRKVTHRVVVGSARWLRGERDAISARIARISDQVQQAISAAPPCGSGAWFEMRYAQLELTEARRELARVEGELKRREAMVAQ